MKYLLLLLLIPLTCAAEPATVIRATELKGEPASDATTVAQLAENTTVEALERKGGWTKVKTKAGEGWVKMLALRYGGNFGAETARLGLLGCDGKEQDQVVFGSF